MLLALAYHQIIKGDYYARRAKENYLRVIPVRATRGSIFDRQGLALAYDEPIFNISVIPYQIKKEKDQLFKDLSQFLDYDLNSIYKNYKRNLQGFFSPVDIVIDLDKKTALKLKEDFKDRIFINPSPSRYYPYPQQFSHILGYVQEASSFYQILKKYGYTPLERAGISGVEQYYDAYLKGEGGGDLVEVDVKGKVVGFLGASQAKKGKDIQLTLDSRIQNLAYEAMGRKNGTLILMDSLSGRILALCSLPAFDSNQFIKGGNLREITDDQSKPLLNRAIQATYPMGSVFKPLLAVTALQEKKAHPGTTFTCQGEFKLGLTRFGCWRTHGQQNLYQALAHSCNVYFYNLGLSLGPEFMVKWARRFGLDNLSEIDLPYEKKGFVPSVKWKQKVRKENWFAGDTVNFSIGQGFWEVTPLGVTLALNAIANNGYLVRPYILEAVDGVSSALSSRTHLGMLEENIKTVRRGLRDVVAKETGTAQILNRLNLQIAGKTGTAQTRGKSHGWFVGFFPYRSPKYTICVFLEHGISSYEAVKVVYKFLEKLKEDNLI